MLSGQVLPTAELHDCGRVRAAQQDQCAAEQDTQHAQQAGGLPGGGQQAAGGLRRAAAPAQGAHCLPPLPGRVCEKVRLEHHIVPSASCRGLEVHTGLHGLLPLPGSLPAHVRPPVLSIVHAWGRMVAEGSVLRGDPVQQTSACDLRAASICCSYPEVATSLACYAGAVLVPESGHHLTLWGCGPLHWHKSSEQCPKGGLPRS